MFRNTKQLSKSDTKIMDVIKLTFDSFASDSERVLLTLAEKFVENKLEYKSEIEKQLFLLKLEEMMRLRTKYSNS